MAGAARVLHVKIFVLRGRWVAAHLVVHFQAAPSDALAYPLYVRRGVAKTASLRSVFQGAVDGAMDFYDRFRVALSENRKGGAAREKAKHDSGSQQTPEHAVVLTGCVVLVCPFAYGTSFEKCKGPNGRLRSALIRRLVETEAFTGSVQWGQWISFPILPQRISNGLVHDQ